MLMQRLTEFSESSDVSPRLYSRRPIRYLISLDDEGRLLDPVPVDTSDPKDVHRRRGSVRLAPYLSRSKGIRPFLLADNAHYTLGLSSMSMRPDRPGAMHSSYLELVDRCWRATRSRPVQAVHSFLGAGAPGLSLPGNFNPRDSITFRVGGKYPIDFPEVQQYWASEAAIQTSRELQCLVCGETGPAVENLPGKLKAVPGGHATGSSFISANRPAFESYGLKGTQNAPMCPDCGEKVTGAANRLLLDESSSISFSSAKTVIWTQQELSIDWARILDSPDRPDVLAQVERIKSGVLKSDAGDIRLNCATFSGNGGRAVLRDSLETTVGEAERNLRKWFMSLEIERVRPGNVRPLSIHSLAGATTRSLRDVTPSVVTSLIRCALLGTRTPMGLLQMAVSRSRTERRVTEPRAALIKLSLTSAGGGALSYGSLIALDETIRNHAYLCGRLLAVVESAELSSPGAQRASTVDRYFAIASATPAAVFDRLCSHARYHVERVQKHNIHARRDIETYADKILGDLPAFPESQNIEEQGLFGLGYYHQKVRFLRHRHGLAGCDGRSTQTPSASNTGLSS